ncbi:GAK system XXXCH domain-containing protein [Maridesulfovibrio sp.]|uniref:GAK system XXXCH domain-containing protein n=1 Tax=Maridesulfovibrio sp. TaxID=2795000 RepID=UPI002A18CD7E|nr:GAK system XXXCH domain-containing protein [Maridesulfovibrio sp.]
MGKDSKIERMISTGELPEFFRKMASAMETGATDENAYLSAIEGFEKLKISIRNEQGQTVIKIKARPSKMPDQDETATSEAESRSDTGKPKYTQLKKRMKKSFKTIFKTLHAGEMPPAETVEEFIADSELMTSYTGKGLGDEYYSEYTDACEVFMEAFKAGDQEAAHTACDEINHIKTKCHAKYD